MVEMAELELNESDEMAEMELNERDELNEKIDQLSNFQEATMI